jgi:hypothetical protein
MLGKRASDPTPAVVDDAPGEPVGKGRPTPKRADARKARRNPTPANRKDAAAQVRSRNREERQLARKALLTGDERHLPMRDAGPERRLARDVVDSRFTLGQIFFFLIGAAFALSLVRNDALRIVANLGSLLVLTGIIVDSARNGRRAKTAVHTKYGADDVRGISSYAFMRSLQPRRFRRPPPKVKRGDKVA